MSFYVYETEVKTEGGSGMREIKFRGKSVMPIEELNRLGIAHENGWVKGNLIVNGDRPYIVGDIADSEEEWIAPEFWVRVIQRTVGQFTGLKDKNGVKVFDGDILKRVVTIVVYGTGNPPEDVEDIAEVKWREDYAGFYVGERPLFAEIDATSDYFTGCRCTKFEVIGNIHENPELLEVTN